MEGTSLGTSDRSYAEHTRSPGCLSLRVPVLLGDSDARARVNAAEMRGKRVTCVVVALLRRRTHGLRSYNKRKGLGGDVLSLRRYVRVVSLLYTTE